MHTELTKRYDIEIITHIDYFDQKFWPPKISTYIGFIDHIFYDPPQLSLRRRLQFITRGGSAIHYTYQRGAK